MTKISFKTFGPKQIPADQVFISPKQTHSATIREVVTGHESLENCDGLWTRNPDFILGVKTADCAPIAFYNDDFFGVVHAGWRGCVNGIIESSLEIARQSPNKTHFKIGPILPQFEIQKDGCYEVLKQKFGTKFFNETAQGIIFDFKACLKYMIPEAKFDHRNTLTDSQLVSWRENQTADRNLTLIGADPNWL